MTDDELQREIARLTQMRIGCDQEIAIIDLALIPMMQEAARRGEEKSK